ncbi:hypothetical protein, partial [Escherichia coli]|uniref:hypothetical protein n=1 Tax=Escherichia coli TaxID=562 RepID=UPI001AA12CC6
MGSCAAPSAKGDDKFITTDYLQQCPNSLHSVVRLRRAVSPFSKPEEFSSYDPLIDPFWIFH